MVKKSRANKLLLTFGIFKIPMIAFVNPRVVEITNDFVVVRVKKNWRTKNHFNSMYIGAFAVGSDVSSGILAYMKGIEGKFNPSLIFKNFTAEFYSRANATVYFVCKNGSELDEMFAESRESGERINRVTEILAYTHYYSEQKVLVAKMTLEVSVKISA